MRKDKTPGTVDADMLAGAHSGMFEDVSSVVVRRDQKVSQQFGLQPDVQTELVAADGLAVEQDGGSIHLANYGKEMRRCVLLSQIYCHC